MDGVWIVYVRWDEDHTSPPIGPFTGPRAYTEANRFATSMRKNLRAAGKKWSNRTVFLSYVASPTRALSWVAS